MLVYQFQAIEMKLCQSILFPNGKSHHGEASEMEFAFGNFHNEHMNGREVPFNIGNYMEAFKLKYVKLYFLSKKVTSGSKEIDDDLPPMLTVCDTPTFSQEKKSFDLQFRQQVGNRC